MDLGLAGKNVIVTGGSKGIGKHIALGFAREGANVAICARTAGPLREAEAELRSHIRRTKWIGMILCLCITGGCTSTAPTISNVQYAPQPLNLLRARVAILSFTGAPDHPETGRVAREIATALLVQHYGVSLVSPSKVDAYLKEHSLLPSEYDREALETAAQGLSAEIMLWGTINQFTPYRFDRLAPATPPYVELTLFGFRVGQASVAKITGRKQGGLPATIWNRQPTFEDVTQPLIAQLLSDLR